MAFTTPRTWAVGEVVTAALMNTHLRDNMASTIVRLDDTSLTSLSTYDEQSIDQSFSALLVVFAARSGTAGAADSVYMRFNNDSGTNYEFENFEAINTTLAGAGNATQTSIHVGFATGQAVTSGAGMGFVLIPDYTGGFHKETISASFGRDGTGGAANLRLRLTGGIWKDTDPISRIQIGAVGGGSITGRVTLYGLAA